MKEISKIKDLVKNPLIFVVIHDENRKDNSFSHKVDKDTIIMNIGRYGDILGITRNNMRDFVMQHFIKYIGDFKSYEYNIIERIRSLASFNDFVNRFRKYTQL
jgi:hypothetical protein